MDFAMNNTVIIFGGDGFCGWPTSLYLSNQGYNVIIVDNLSRRKIDIELECDSLTPIQPITKRIQTWKKITNHEIQFKLVDLSENYHRILTLFKTLKPKAVVHFAEQRAAPYSMKGPFEKRYTVYNNINVTHNILCAIVESGLDIHMIHLGTTGVYGYSSIGMEIPEGYLNVRVDVEGVEKCMEIPYPPQPGSIYHMTKTMDALMFSYYNKNDNLRITDLHQGIVWGTETDETKLDELLINRFDYDGDYGTVLNRFVMQAATGHPLTVHGTGGQTRAFIHIKDTIQCIKLAIENPPQKNDPVKIFNQTTEQHNVRKLAEKISSMTGAEIRYFVNPRKEDRDNDLRLSCKNFLELGLKPITLNDGLMNEIHDIASKYQNRCDKSKIICTSVWQKEMIVDHLGSSFPIIERSVQKNI
jgi:UDP-sulfoquinovose synthase